MKMEQTKTMVLTDEMGKTVLIVRMEYCDRQAIDEFDNLVFISINRFHCIGIGGTLCKPYPLLAVFCLQSGIGFAHERRLQSVVYVYMHISVSEFSPKSVLLQFGTS